MNAEEWARVAEAFDAHVLRFVHRRQVGGRARLHQVSGDLGLAVDRHALAGQAMQIDAVQLVAEA